MADLLRRRSGGPELLAYKDGRRWKDVTSTDINSYVKEQVGGEVSAKDFRTWHGTVIAAVALAGANADATSATARKRAVSRRHEAGRPSTWATRPRWRGAPTSTRG